MWTLNTSLCLQYKYLISRLETCIGSALPRNLQDPTHYVAARAVTCNQKDECGPNKIPHSTARRCARNSNQAGAGGSGIKKAVLRRPLLQALSLL